MLIMMLPLTTSNGYYDINAYTLLILTVAKRVMRIVSKLY